MLVLHYTLKCDLISSRVFRVVHMYLQVKKMDVVDALCLCISPICHFVFHFLNESS